MDTIKVTRCDALGQAKGINRSDVVVLDKIYKEDPFYEDREDLEGRLYVVFLISSRCLYLEPLFGEDDLIPLIHFKVSKL